MTQAEEIAQRVLDRFGYIPLRTYLDLAPGHICDHIADTSGNRVIEANVVVCGPATEDEEREVFRFLGLERAVPLLPGQRIYKVAAE